MLGKVLDLDGAIGQALRARVKEVMEYQSSGSAGGDSVNKIAQAVKGMADNTTKVVSDTALKFTAPDVRRQLIETITNAAGGNSSQGDDVVNATFKLEDQKMIMLQFNAMTQQMTTIMTKMHNDVQSVIDNIR